MVANVKISKFKVAKPVCTNNILNHSPMNFQKSDAILIFEYFSHLKVGIDVFGIFDADSESPLI